MDAKLVKKLAKELQGHAKTLGLYRDQLLARHKVDPLKSPPLFLLNSTAIALEFKAAEILEALKK